MFLQITTNYNWNLFVHCLKIVEDMPVTVEIYSAVIW
jgi:hypothetical protein